MNITVNKYKDSIIDLFFMNPSIGFLNADQLSGCISRNKLYKYHNEIDNKTFFKIVESLVHDGYLVKCDDIYFLSDQCLRLRKIGGFHPTGIIKIKRALINNTPTIISIISILIALVALLKGFIFCKT